MKTKVIIENGETTIVLTPENDFEKDILIKMKEKEQNFNIHTKIDAEWKWGEFINSKLIVSIKEIK